MFMGTIYYLVLIAGYDFLGNDTLQFYGATV